MANLNLKIKKMAPILKAKKFKVDEESLALSKIKLQKENALTELQRYQKLYIEGIDKLNIERQSSDRSRLPVLETSIDFAKSKWYESLSILKEFESKEKQQLNELIKAQQDLHVFEKLQEKYKKELLALENQKEQKILDDHSIKAFNSRR